MLGAIIGDIVGSRFEWNNHKSKDFEFLHPNCFFTDDTVMTLAVALALAECNGNYDELSFQAILQMQKLGQKYSGCSYGGRFAQWLINPNPQPYNSWGNGAAMRVSACAYFAKSVDEVKELSDKVTRISHNHTEGLKGATATAIATHLAYTGKTKDEIRQYVMDNYYKINFTLEEIRENYRFDESCQGTVPQALEAFFEAESYEDAVRNAISIGGDSDTIAAITGAVAEAYYGIPEDMKIKGLAYLDDNLRKIFDYVNIKIKDLET